MVRAFVLGVVALAVVGVCTVRETSRQIQARYELERLLRREDDMIKRLARLHTDEQALRAPARLAKIVREKHLDLYALSRGEPAAARAGARKNAARTPGTAPGNDTEAMAFAGAGTR